MTAHRHTCGVLVAFALLGCTESRPPQSAPSYPQAPPPQFSGPYYPPPYAPPPPVYPAPEPPPAPSASAPSATATGFGSGLAFSVATGGLAAPGGTPAPSAEPPPPAGPPVTYALVSLVGLTVGPGKYDGHSWDPGGGDVDPRAVAAIGVAMKMPDAYSQVLALLAGPTVAALAKPDVFGTASLVDSSGSSSELRFGWVRDSFTPDIPNVTWKHVPIDNVRVRVAALDHDLAVDDPMGTFELGPADFHHASDAGHVYRVRVDEQTNGQILFASISVLLEPGLPSATPPTPAPPAPEASHGTPSAPVLTPGDPP